jgi:hypothetical protein
LAHRETEEPSRLPFYESAEPNIPAASYCGMACLAGTCKTLTMFHDGTHGLSPGTDGSNPLPSRRESTANLTAEDVTGQHDRRSVPHRLEANCEGRPAVARTSAKPLSNRVVKESVLGVRRDKAAGAVENVPFVTRAGARASIKNRIEVLHYLIIFYFASDGLHTRE